MTWDWLKFKPLDPAWLNGLNTSAYKAVYTVWLWVATCMVWAVCAINEIHMDTVAFGLWLGGLAGLSGFSYAAYKTQRTTDYGYMERKAAAPAPNTVVEAGAQVQVASPPAKKGKP